MSFSSQANLAKDALFQDRVLACCLEQALIFKDDGRYSFSKLADQYIQSPQSAIGLFQLVCVSPNFKEISDSSEIPDVEILSAVQANWSVMGELLYPEPPPEPEEGPA